MSQHDAILLLLCYYPCFFTVTDFIPWLIFAVHRPSPGVCWKERLVWGGPSSILHSKQAWPLEATRGAPALVSTSLIPVLIFHLGSAITHLLILLFQFVVGTFGVAWGCATWWILLEETLRWRHARAQWLCVGSGRLQWNTWLAKGRLSWIPCMCVCQRRHRIYGTSNIEQSEVNLSLQWQDKYFNG